MPSATQTAPLVELTGVSKIFGTVQALADVDFVVNRHEVVGLIGENGAGKSTLLKILGGVHQPTTGEIKLDGTPVRLRTTRQALDRGIGMVYQEQSLLPNLTVAENIHLGLSTTQRKASEAVGIFRWRQINSVAQKALDRVGSPIDPRRPLEDLSFAERQIVEIAKAVTASNSSLGVPLVVLDEPTSILEAEEVTALEAEIASLRQQGSVIFVSHRMSEVLNVSDRIYVMRAGRIVAEIPAAQADESELYRLMAGREIEQKPRRTRLERTGTPRLEVQGLSSADHFHGIGLTLWPGEIVTVAGVQGSGREQFMRALFGAVPVTAGSVRLDGQLLDTGSVRKAIDRGIAYVPAERKAEGLVQGLSIASNITLTHPGNSGAGVLRFPRRATSIARKWIERLTIRPPDPAAHVDRLSGGNAQKVVLAKWLSDSGLRLLLLDHPLRGLDPGAQDQVADMFREACADGVAILLLADTLDEALRLGDRVVVMRDGGVTGQFDLHESAVSAVDLVERMV